MTNILNFLKPQFSSLLIDLSFSKVRVSYRQSSQTLHKEFILDENIETGVLEGRLDDSEKLRDTISYIEDLTSTGDKRILHPLSKSQISIVLRYKCPIWQKKLVENITQHLLYDSLYLTSHEELSCDKFAVLYFENEGVFFQKNEAPLMLNTYPKVANRSVQQFIEAKYNMSVSDSDVSVLLVEYFNLRPSKIGKKIVTYDIRGTDTSGKTKIISPSFHEILDSLRPTLIAFAYDLDYISQKSNSAQVTLVSENVWIESAMKDIKKYTNTKFPNFLTTSIQEFRNLNTPQMR